MIPEDQVIDIITVKPMTALQFLISMRPCIPMSTERPCTETSNSELRRWLEKGSVIINGTKPKPQDIVSYPITELVFFPKSPRRTTVF